MPDYFPQVQLPQGLAESLIRIMQQKAMMPAQAVAGVADSITNRLNNSVSTQQLQAMGVLPKSKPAGFIGPEQPGEFLPPGFPSRISRIAAELGASKMAQDTMTKRALTVQGMRGEQAASKEQADYLKNHVKATADMLKNYPNVAKMGFREGDLVPDRFLSDQTKAAAGQGKADAATEKLWEGLNRAVNPANAARGSLLGQAGQGNARADRALTTLASKTVTPQQVQAVVNDYAGIMQGGAPHEIALRQLGYDNLATRWTNLMQFLRSKPEAVNTPEVVGQLRQMVMEIKEVDNQIISNNLDTVEQTHSGLVTKDPARWAKIRDMVMKTTVSSGQASPKKASPIAPAGKASDPLGVL